MQTFPDTTVTHILLEGYQEQPGSALLRTEMESGPPKQARILARVIVSRPVVCDFTSLANYQYFKTWVRDGLNYGADWFLWTDPVDGVQKQARIQGGKITGSPVHLNYWRASFILETWSA